MEYQAGQQSARSTVSLEAPESAWPEYSYAIHPACMDGCFQTVLSSAWKGDRSAVDAALVPLSIDSLVVPWNSDLLVEAIAVAKSEFTGVGRSDVAKKYSASTAVFHPANLVTGIQQSAQQAQTHSDSKDIQAIFVLLRSKAEPAALLEVTVDVLNRYLMTSLRLPESLDVARPLSAYAIDSLAAVEFRNWLRTELGVDLSTLEIVNAPSLVSICEKVISKIPNA